LEKARELDIPKEIVERNIKKASEKGQETYTEKVYEVTSLEARMIFLAIGQHHLDCMMSQSMSMSNTHLQLQR
jgi:hypothetical protein